MTVTVTLGRTWEVEDLGRGSDSRAEWVQSGPASRRWWSQTQVSGLL